MPDLLGQIESRRDAAVGIAIEAGVLQVCMIHDDGMFTGAHDIEEAYKLASARFKAGDKTLISLFDNQRDLTDEIQHQVAMFETDLCPSCDSAGNS